MRKLLVLLPAFFLAACDGGVNPIDPQKILGALDGPKVPTVQDAMTDSAKNAEAQGNFTQAASIYRQILDKHPDDKNVVLALADSYRRAGDNDQAMALYDGLLTQDKDNLAAKEGKGLALMAKGDFDTPGILFQEIMKADPKRWKTLNALGILFTTRNMQPEAQQYFREAQKYHSASATISNNIGLSQALDRKYDEAIATLTQASTLAGGNPLQRKRIDLNTALVYATAGKLDEARSIAANYYSGAALDNNMGLYAHLAKDDQMAKSYLNMALTESKVFYGRAWDNLQNIDAGNKGGAQEKTSKNGKISVGDDSEKSSSASDNVTTAPKEHAKTHAAKKKSKKPSVKKDKGDGDEISAIVGSHAKKTAKTVKEDDDDVAAIVNGDAKEAKPAAKVKKSSDNDDIDIIARPSDSSAISDIVGATGKE